MTHFVQLVTKLSSPEIYTIDRREQHSTVDFLWTRRPVYYTQMNIIYYEVNVFEIHKVILAANN